MALTSQLGTVDSRLGNVVLGLGAGLALVLSGRFYLRALTANHPPTAGDKSTSLPEGGYFADLNSGAGFEDLALRQVKGTSQTSKAVTTSPDPVNHSCYVARFTSQALAAQTIPAATWTLAVLAARQGGLGDSNAYIQCCIYVWRPSTSAVVGYIHDSNQTSADQVATTADGIIGTYTGASVTAARDDVLVCEVWFKSAQSNFGTFSRTLYFDGATEVVDGSTADAASYLETPDGIALLTGMLQRKVRGVGL